MLGNFDEHITNKEDNDPILDYKYIQESDIDKSKIKLGLIPFYAIDINSYLALTLHRLERMRENNDSYTRGVQHVLPINPYQFAKIHSKKKYLSVARTSFINLPASSGMKWISKKLKREIPENISTISYVMNLLRLAHAKNYSIFLVGSSLGILEKLFANLNRSFPRIRIVGRHHGFLKGEAQKRVMEALKKTDPHIILLGMGFHNEMKWIYENKDKLGNCILVSMGGYIDVLAGARKKSPDFIETRNLSWLWRCFNRPQRWFRLFTVFFLILKIYYWKLFKKNKMIG